jgi:hypothetical protein
MAPMQLVAIFQITLWLALRLRHVNMNAAPLFIECPICSQNTVILPMMIPFFARLNAYHRPMN